ncbi:MAG: hypothetical protein EHM93_13745 [Bacteroidales bacterium]|nr:MAG: hypothetical protein EHM93_13745 [Bacteroidales bacterium]
MKRFALIGLITFFSTINSFGQINMTDSTVQVVGYWNKNEKQLYAVTNEKYKIKGTDTTSREFWKYDVEITIIDSTANSYIIEWFYRNYSVDADNELIKKLSSICQDIKVIIKTNELGVFIEVINWQDIIKEIKKATSTLKDEFKNIPNMDKIIQQIENLYSSKEAIETSAISDIQQFYTYHGGKYKLGEEINTKMQRPNLYGVKPFDADLTLWLDEINPEDNNFIIRMNQVVDSTQLTDAAYTYLSKMTSSLGTKLPKREEFPSLKNETRTASRIHGSGWIIYTVETKEVSAENQTNIEERIIEIK